MKIIGAFISIGLLCMAGSAAQAADCSALPPQDHSEAAVRQLDMDWSRAYYTGDQAFLECLYATGFSSADSRGVLHGRDDDISGARDNLGKSWTPKAHKYEQTIQMFPHSAVVTMLRRDGKHGARITDIYEYDGRRWHATFSQSTKF